MDKNHKIESSSDELLIFINKERLSKKVNYKKIFKFFSKCLKKSINELNTKFISLNNRSEAIISGINMIYHIYFLLINYSNNIKLTIFLLERAILLYTEFIIMSQNQKMVDEIYFVPNINDAVSFSFKKTIGPIFLNDIENAAKSKNAGVKFNSKFLKEISISLKNISKLYFRTKWINEETSMISLKIEENFENIDKIFSNKKISDEEIYQFKKYSALCTEQSLLVKKDEDSININVNDADIIISNDNDNNDNDADNEFKNNDTETQSIPNKLNQENINIKIKNILVETNTNAQNNDNAECERYLNQNMTLEEFLNTINNEIIELLLALHSQNYQNIIKQITCIISGKDSVNLKIGKIKIILFLFNKDLLNVTNQTNIYCHKLNKNQKFIKVKKEILNENSSTISKIFDILVNFKFSTLSHSLSVIFSALKISSPPNPI